MKITTKTGDKGRTRLFGGRQVSKSSDVIEVLGTLDELQAFVGWCHFVIGLKEGQKICKILDKIQSDLFRMMSIIGGCAKVRKISEKDVRFLEDEIKKYEKGIEDIKKFVKPGLTEASCRFHIARTVCRRAERGIVRYGKVINKNFYKIALKYLNRLSDLMFVLACKFEIGNL